MINEKLKQHAVQALSSGIRTDGRGLLDYRPFTIETGVSSTAHGSARVTSGDQVVVTGVKFELGTPYPDTPQDGSLMVGAELLPLANSAYEAGPPGIDSIELARVIDRTIRESKAMDLTTLCIEEGKSAWTVAVDIMPVNANGPLFDIGALAALAAILDSRKPAITDGVPQYEQLTEEKLTLVRRPIMVTVFKIGPHFLIDPTQEEEKYCDARLSVASLDEQTVCALQKGLEGSLTIQDVERMVEIGLSKGAELRALLDN